MSVLRVECPFFAPVPVGHRVTLLGIEHLDSPLFGGPSTWKPLPHFLVLDEHSRVVYADAAARLHSEASFEQIRFQDDTYRLSTTQPPLRGQVVSCLALSDHGDSVYLRTVLGITPDAPQQRF